MAMSPMQKLFNLRHPFLAPLYRRVLTTGFSGGWALFEMLQGNPGWAIMFGAVAVYCFYEFFVVFDPDNYKEKNDE